MSNDNQFIEYIKKGNLSAVQNCLEANPHFANITTKQNLSIVLLATYYGHDEIVKLFLSIKPKLNIFEACATGVLKEVKRNHQNNVSINSFAPDGFTPLGLACFFDHERVVTFLINQGADVNIPSNNDFKVAPLHSAVAKKSVSIARLLLTAGAEANARQNSGVTPLHSAAHLGQLEMVQLLLDNGADVNAKMIDGKTPLEMAKEHGFLQIENILLNHGAL